MHWIMNDQRWFNGSQVDLWESSFFLDWLEN
jgi:hypothetical protein